MDKKLTDTEIKKALEKLYNTSITATATDFEVLNAKGLRRFGFFIKEVIDLINRYEEKNSNLTSDLTSLQNDLTSAKAEVERLQKAIQVQEIMLGNQDYVIKQAKTEAYKECIEKVKENSFKLNMCHGDIVIKTDYQISGEKLDNLLKEMGVEGDV